MRTILITGASGDIGRAIAERLADRDTTLILHGRNITKLEKTCSAAREKDAKIIAFPGDFHREKDLNKFIARAAKEQIDVIIHSTGLAIVEPFEKIALDAWNKALHLNVTVPFYITQQLIEHLTDNGMIVNIMSVAAKTGFPGWTSYCTGKFALDGFSKSLREELRAKKIRVSNIYPAATDTGLWDSIDGDWNRDKMMKPTDVAEAVAFAIAQPPHVSVDAIEVNNTGGNL
ncbi:MAG: SDR family oxidoreductase [Candidatus Zixiibacteriota bacterium]